MADELCTVEEAAERLKLHPRTVLRFIREGRLKAARVGRAYRILRADVEAMAGIPAPPERPAEAATVTSIVEIPEVSDRVAQRWARSVTAALNGRSRGGPSLRADVIHDRERSHLKIVVVGPAGDVINLLNLIRVWLEQLRP